jgi:DNA primase small subunit
VIFTLPQGSSNLVKTLFREYYEKASLELPFDMELREFAFQPFDSPSYVRHLSFNNELELKTFITKTLPLHLFYSSAKYQIPSAKDMEEKGWMGADIQFDLDADHFCEVKKFNFCPVCGDHVQGDKCPKDGTQTVEYMEITKDCIDQTRDKTIDLVDILKEDFDFKPKIYFSGNRGFHVIIECSGDCALLNSDDRKEISEYVMGFNIPKYQGKPCDPGWPGRLAKNKKGVEIDEQVTIDTKRLIRIPGSLHGKSGLVVKQIGDLSKFSYNKDLSPFTGFSVFLPFITGEFDILGERIKFYKNTQIKLETSLAIYSTLKNLGEVTLYVR